MKGKDIELFNIYNLMGKIDQKDLKCIDTFVNNQIGMLMPVSGVFKRAMTSFHSHPSYLFVMTFNGQVSFRIDKKEIVTQLGMLTAFSPSTVHREIYSEHSPRYIAIFIAKDFFEDQLKRYDLEKIPVFRGDSIQVPQGFLANIRDFMIEADNRLPGWEQMMHGLNLSLCHSIIRSLIGLEIDFDRITSRLDIDRAIEYMHNHIGDKLTLEELAAFANMSPSHFSRVFKKETGRSAISYLNEVRHEKVKRLLLLGEFSITEIALECGFGSPSYLSATFQKRYGQSPSDYRKMYLEKNKKE